jgi:hypothetical protein
MQGSIRFMISNRFDPIVIPGRNEGANPGSCHTDFLRISVPDRRLRAVRNDDVDFSTAC